MAKVVQALSSVSACELPKALLAFHFGLLMGAHLDARLRSPKSKSQELQFRVCYVTDLCLLFIEFQKQLTFDVRLDIFKGSLRGSFASAEDHHIVRVAREAVAAVFELVIEFVEQDVG